MKYICNYSSHEEFLNGIPTDKDNIILCRAPNIDDWHMHWNCSLFDKRVEYLQNPVGAFIMLPYMPNNNIGYEIKWCRAEANAIERAPLGCWTAWKNKMWGDDFKAQSGTNKGLLICWGNGNTELATGTYHINDFVIWKRVGTKFYYNGSNISTNTAYTFQCDRNISIFGVNVGGTTPYYQNPMKIAYVKIFNINTNENIFDLIPVRKGSIGYMYDKVSGELYGNDGSGEFICGPDLE